MSDLNIVIIDDEPSALMTLKLLISKIAENYNVVAEISSVKQAMEKLPKLDYDVYHSYPTRLQAVTGVN